MATNYYKLLKRLGCTYHYLAPVGWYFQSAWIGYNSNDARKWLEDHGICPKRKANHS